MEKVAESIKNAKKVVILPHINADGDAVASCKAMSCALSDMGIDNVIYAEEKPESRLDFISDGVLVYDGKTTECDTCIVLDCGDEERMGKRKAIADGAGTVINIDHHKTNTHYGDVSYVVDDASATGEVLYDIFKAMDIAVTKPIAMYLYTAICSDTGNFAFSNVSPKTFTIAAELIKHNINHAEISRLLFNCVDIETEQLKAEMVKTVRSYYDGKVTTVHVTREMAEKYGVSTDELDGIVDIPRRIRGTEIAVSFKEKEDGIRVSLRSNGDCDVSQIAMKFNGGGHIKASGCTVYADIQKAEELVVDACRMAFDGE